jgi:hypothetical protein
MDTCQQVLQKQGIGISFIEMTEGSVKGTATFKIVVPGQRVVRSHFAAFVAAFS